MSETPLGRVVTFYSYKGGTGRSMALANVAWILASRGKRVIVLDWDLEAPGLHRYFYPFLLDRDLRSTEGLIDFFSDFVLEAATHRPGDGDPLWYTRYADLVEYAVTLEWKRFGGGRLDLVPAGRQGPAYSTRVNSFDWQGFYDRLGGGAFLEAVKAELRGKYDYILIDSRTGVSDTAGICTVQMPDVLVVCFTLNNQSIDGALAVAESVFMQRKGDIRVLPVPTRVEINERDRRTSRLAYAQDRFAYFPNHLLDQEARAAYWARSQFIYIPFYAFEEVLSPFKDTPGESASLLQSASVLADYITDGEVTSLDPASVDEVPRIIAAYQEQAQAGKNADMELVRAAEALVSAAPPERREAFRRVVVRLVAPPPPGSGELPRRARVTAADLDPADADALRELAAAGVVEIDPEGGEGTFRLASDWLCTAWSRARQWVEADREFLAWLHVMQPAASAWKRLRRSGGDHEALLRDPALRDAEEWLAQRVAQLTPTERELVEALADRKDGELLQAAARVEEGWTPDERAAARRVLPRLVRVAPATLPDADTPATVALDELRADAAEPVDDLLEAGVLVKVQGSASTVAVRLARPALMGWTLLREWMEADRDFLRWQDELRLNEAQWRAALSADEGLLRGPQLERVERWRARLDDLPAPLRAYVAASEELRDRERVRDAERCVALLGPAEENAVRQALVRAARSPNHATTLAAGEIAPPGVRAAFERLCDAGVLKMEIPEADGSVAVRLTSPALATRWSRLAGWLAAEREAELPPVRSQTTSRSGPQPRSRWQRAKARSFPWLNGTAPVRGRWITPLAVALAVVITLLAIGAFPRRAAIGPVEPEHTAEELNLEGRLAIDQQDYEGAALAFSHAVERDPKYVPAWLNLATASTYAGDYERARAALARADSLTPNSPAVRVREAALLYRQKDYAGTVRKVEEIPLGALDAWAYTYLGLARRELGDRAAGDSALVTAVARDSTIEPARTLVAQMRQAQGQQGQAAYTGPPEPRLEQQRVEVGTGRRVYLHHATARDTLFANWVAARAVDRGFCIPRASISRPGTKVPTVIYTWAEDAAAAEEVRTILRYALHLRGFPEEVVIRPATNAPQRGRPGHLEVWLAPLPAADTVAPVPRPSGC
ncbi:MAG TPA: tetratricopeptide repeat protein [Longimicrobium sp.]|nr:tetratricopeptide repeat protein [Longimicrobium sp.]